MLAATVLVQSLGVLLTASKVGTPVNSWLFLNQHWTDASSRVIDGAGAILTVLGSAVLVLARRPLVRIVSAGAMSGWYVVLALAEWRTGDVPFAAFSVAAEATRIAAPLAIALWDRQHAVEWILRPAIALTFATHGMEALRLHPVFIDYILMADRNLFGIGLAQPGAEHLLRLIGAHDVLLATFVLAGGRGRWVLGWMALWGMVTAASRVVQGGEGAAYLALIRAANGGLPLVLALLSPPGIASASRSREGAVRHLPRAALPLLLLLLPVAAGAQGSVPSQLRVIWKEDPAHRATIAWSTPTAGSTHQVHIDTVPRFGDVGAYARTVTAGGNGQYTNGGAFYHHAEITGLLPSTTYYFVAVTDGRASEEHSFLSAPVDDRPFRLLYGGDSRKPGEADRRRMNQLISSLVEQDPGILALAHGGDYIQSEDSWQEWDSWMTDHQLIFTSSGRILPIIPVRGNHEGDGVMFNQVFGFPGGPLVDYFPTKIGANTLLVTLDSNVSIGGEQTKWLERQLQDAGNTRWILASYHRPAYPAQKEPSGARQFWVPLFERYNVDAALESDGHVLKRTVPIRNDKQDSTGVVYVGEGGLGVPQRTPNQEWYLNPPGMAMSGHHVQLFSFTPTELTYEAVLMSGAVADTWVFRPKRAGVAAEAGPPTEPSEPGSPTEPSEPGGTTEPTEPGFQPVAVDAVTARSPTEVVVTFSVEMDPATAGRASSYSLSPLGEVEDVRMEDAWTAVLTTTELLPTAEYSLRIDGPTSADGDSLPKTRMTFSVRALDQTPDSTPTITPAAQGSATGCTAAGVPAVVACLLGITLAANLRRRVRR